MSNASAKARKAAYLFLVLCCGALLAYLVFYLQGVLGPSKITVGGEPYGLPAGSTIECEKTFDINEGVKELPVQTQAELRRAVELFRGGSVRSAYEIFEAVALLYPDLTFALWNQVNSLFEMDSLSAIEKERMHFAIRKLQEKFPESGISVYLESHLIYKQGSSTSAMELAKVASEKSPALYEIRLWYAKLLYENNRLQQALQEVRTSVSLSSGKNPKAYEILSYLYHDLGTLDTCSFVIEYALTQYPMNAKLLLLQGYLAEYQGHYDNAERIYNKIIALRPDFTDANIALSTLGEKNAPGKGNASLSPRDRSQVAFEILEPLVERYPENLPLREALGLAYLKAREFDRARFQFNEIQNRDADYPEIQQRIKECNYTKPVIDVKSNVLADDLNRALDSLREVMSPSSTHDFSTKLGHYLVRYGASTKEFFKKYAINNFKPVKTNVWQESFFDSPYKHTYTVVFDSTNHFREVHVTVYDSSSSSNHLGVAPEIYTRLLKQNSRISGIGNSTGETDCGDGVIIDAAVWETQDNFEILARFIGTPAEVKMVRFDKNYLSPGLKLCDYVPYLKEF